VRVGEFYYFNHQYDLAIRQLRQTLEFDSTYRLAQASIAYAFSQAGKHDSAIVWASKATRGPPSYGVFTSALGTAYALAGRRSDALAVIDSFRRQAKQHDVIPLSYAMIYAALGDRDSAFLWLDRSYADRDWSLTWLRAEPVFDPLHSDPRWDALVRRMKFP
jgi:tetratricopeptide (TPR) repeat protein